MRSRTASLVVVLVMAILTGCSGDSTESEATEPAATLPPSTSTTSTAPTTTVADQAGPVIERRLVYATSEGATLKLDLYIPIDSSGAPIVISDSTVMGTELVEQGVIVVVHEVKPPVGLVIKEQWLGDSAAQRAMAEQYACAIRFARTRASELGSDDPIVVATGHSEHGAVAAHAALFGETLEAHWDEFAATGGPPRQVECEITDGSTHVDAFVGVAGGYEAFVPIYDGYWVRALQESNWELWEFLSNPMGANPNLKVRLIHGTADEAIPMESSIDFADALADRGYDVQVIPFDGGHHDMPPTVLYSSTINEVLSP